MEFTCLRSHLLTSIKFQTVIYRRKTSSSLDYCVDVVRQYDYENFLATLLLSNSVRSPSLALRAFNVEVARVQDQTTDLNTAQFRLQFWQDTIDKIYNSGKDAQNVPAHPIAQELFNVCSKNKIPKRQLQSLIQSRKTYLKTKYFRNLEAIEKYSEETVSTLFYLILNLSDVKNIHADHAASHLGKAQGITNLLRSVQVSSALKTVTLPLDMLTKHGVSQEDVLRCCDSKEMRNVAYDMASRANSHLNKAREISVPGNAASVFLPAIAVDSYLKRLQNNNFNIFDKSLHKRMHNLPLVLFYNKLLKRF